MSSSTPKLLVAAKGSTRVIEKGQEMTIGRGYSNLLRLEGEEISRVHAIIYKRNQDFILRDLDSKNGVFVNGNRVVTVTLDSGDLLQVGKYRMVFNPPAGFNINSALKPAGDAGGSVDVSGPEMDISDGDFSRSQIFSGIALDDSIATGDGHFEPELLREEVLLFTRLELDGRLASDQSSVSEKATDYQEDFFKRLLAGGTTPADESLDFLTSALQAAVHAVSADRGVIVLRNPQTETLQPGAIVPDKGDVAVNRVVLQSGFGEGKAIICPATAECGLFRESNTVRRDRIASLLSIPLGRRKIFGLLYMDRQGEADGFNLAHLLAMANVGRLLELHLRDKADKI